MDHASRPSVTGPPTFLLIPGFMLDADLWSDCVPILGGPARIRYADLSRGASLAEMAELVLADAPPRFVAVGFSMGGYVARELVRSAPERVEALVLVATSARGDGEVQARRKAALAAGAGTGSFRGLSTGAVTLSLYPANRGRTDLVERIQAMGRRLGGEVFGRQSLLDRFDERSALAAIRCPTLVVAGDDDVLRAREESMELHAGIAGSTLRVIANTGHMVPMEEPRRLAGLIVDWLATMDPPARAAT